MSRRVLGALTPIRSAVGPRILSAMAPIDRLGRTYYKDKAPRASLRRVGLGMAVIIGLSCAISTVYVAETAFSKAGMGARMSDMSTSLRATIGGSSGQKSRPKLSVSTLLGTGAADDSYNADEMAFHSSDYDDRIEETEVDGLLPAAVHTPYHLTPGGGERVVLTMVATLQHLMSAPVDLWVRPDNVCTNLQCLRKVTNVLDVQGFDFNRVRMRVVGRDGNLERDQMYLLWVFMENGLMPTERGHGLLNVYHCQFPFDGVRDNHFSDDDWRRLQSYQLVYLNSRYTENHYRRFLGLEEAKAVANAKGAPDPKHAFRPKCLPKLTHFPPPVTLLDDEMRGREFHGPRRGLNIIIVGRIFDDLQGKKQLEAIRAFEKVRKRHHQAKLYVVGAAVTGHESYLGQVREAAERTPGVELVVNAKKTHMIDMMFDSLIVWSITGMGRPEMDNPGDAEHFGLALVEAMSTGLIPIVLGKGGPVEITEGTAGAQIVKDEKELAEKTIKIMNRNKDHLRFRNAALERARHQLGFEDNFKALFAPNGVQPSNQYTEQWKNMLERQPRLCDRPSVRLKQSKQRAGELEEEEEEEEDDARPPPTSRMRSVWWSHRPSPSY